MFLDLIELANSLDEHIEKGEKLEKSSKAKKRDSLRKAFTFDPYNPIAYTEDSGYYNPYRLVDGGYLPHPVEYWESQGKGAPEGQHDQEFKMDGYRTTKELYDRFKPVQQATQNFRAFRRSLEMDLIKAGAVPIGTVHTYSDGERYVKREEGKWVPVAASHGARMGKYLSHPNKQWSSQANTQISAHAEKIARIKDAIERKTKVEAGSDQLKAALDTMKTHFSKFYEGGKIPDDVHEFFDKVSKNPNGLESAGKEAASGKAKDKSNKDVADTPKNHHVSVEFSHNNQNYTHKFDNIQANSHGEAVSKIMQIMDKKLPGHQMKAIHAQSEEPKKENNGSVPKEK